MDFGQKNPSAEAGITGCSGWVLKLNAERRAVKTRRGGRVITQKEILFAVAGLFVFSHEQPHTLS